MRTNIEIPDKLMKQALSVSGHKTKRDVVLHALQVLIAYLKKRELAQLRGKVKWSGDLDEMRQV
jgi:Arc/MetJ family transcription regulator